jgi:hypothetical protein
MPATERKVLAEGVRKRVAETLSEGSFTVHDMSTGEIATEPVLPVGYRLLSSKVVQLPPNGVRLEFDIGHDTSNAVVAFTVEDPPPFGAVLKDVAYGRAGL